MGNPPYAEWQQDNPSVRLVPFAEAGAHGELIVNATAGTGALSALEAAGGRRLRKTSILHRTSSGRCVSSKEARELDPPAEVDGERIDVRFREPAEPRRVVAHLGQRSLTWLPRRRCRQVRSWGSLQRDTRPDMRCDVWPSSDGTQLPAVS